MARLEKAPASADLINKLLSEPQNPPVTIGPTVFCPENRIGVLGFYNFQKRNLPFLDIPKLQYKIDNSEISRYGFISKIEENIQPPDALVKEKEAYLHFNPDTSINAYLPTLVKEPFKFIHKDSAQNVASGGMGVPLPSLMTLEENCYNLADFVLMQTNAKPEYEFEPPFKIIRYGIWLSKLAYKAYKRGDFKHA